MMMIDVPAVLPLLFRRGFYMMNMVFKKQWILTMYRDGDIFLEACLIICLTFVLGLVVFFLGCECEPTHVDGATICG
jgi:hypothetical protein